MINQADKSTYGVSVHLGLFDGNKEPFKNPNLIKKEKKLQNYTVMHLRRYHIIIMLLLKLSTESNVQLTEC